MRPLVGSLAIAVTALPALGGPKSVIEPIVTEEANNGDWCDWLSDSPGTLYKNKENPFIQKIKLFGRAHYQAVYVDGTEGSETIQDFRRLRAGAEIDFLKFFELKGSVNLTNDNRQRAGLGPTDNDGDLGFGYESIQDAVLTFDAQEAFNIQSLDSFKIRYGKQKLEIGGEQRASSKKIKTIERSAISNRLRDGNDGTGLLIEASKGKWGGSIGYFSNESVDELSYDYFSDGGTYLWAHLSYELTDNDTLFLDYFDSFDFDASASAISPDYSIVASYEMERGPVDVLIEGIYGESQNPSAGRDGNFYAFVFLPSYELNDRTELVFRYQYQGSNEEEGVRVNSRYTRRSGNQDGPLIGDNRGDTHHSVYAGLNYLLCGHNAKVMFGVQYDNIDTPEEGHNEAMTYGAAFRMFF